MPGRTLPYSMDYTLKPARPPATFPFALRIFEELGRRTQSNSGKIYNQKYPQIRPGAER